MTVNERIFNLMEQENIKNADLAKHLNVKNNVITNWKTRGTEPPIKYLVPICELLDITIYELLEIEDKNDIQAAYEKADPAIQEAVRKLLDVKEREPQKQKRVGRGTRVNKLDDWKRKHHLT